MNVLCTKAIEYPQRLYNSFDPAYLIIGVVAFSQGIQHLADLSIQYMFKDDFHLSPATMGLYMSYTSLPWVIKPIWGLFTDSKPLFGYRRKSYLTIFGLAGCLGWVLLAYYGMHDLYFAIGLLILIQFSVCFANVVGEALLVELAGKNKPDQQALQNGSRLSSSPEQIAESNKEFQRGAARNVSIFFGVKSAGVLVSAYSSGALLIYITKKEVFLITAMFPLLLAIIALFLSEKKVDTVEANDRRDIWTFFKNPLIYRPVILIFCFTMAPSSGAIMFFYYTQVLGFSPQFLGQLKFMYGFGSFLGIFLYNSCLRDVSFRKIFTITTLMYYCCYQSLIVLVTRKNLEYGINDKVFCIGDVIMLQLVGELNMMPILVLACRMCPKNLEGTMYAMLMSITNLGNVLGAQWGALFLILLGVNETDFSKLWLFIFLTGLCILIPLPWLHVVKEDAILQERETEDNQIELKKGVQEQIRISNGLQSQPSSSSILKLDEQDGLMHQYDQLEYRVVDPSEI